MEWLRLAISRSVVRRAARIAAVVGVILVVINHGDALLRGDVSLGRTLRIVLTMLVPYCVEMTLHQQQPGVPRMFHQAPARLGEAPLHAGERPAAMRFGGTRNLVAQAGGRRAVVSTVAAPASD